MFLLSGDLFVQNIFGNNKKTVKLKKNTNEFLYFCSHKLINNK